ncbi:MAG: DsbA family protein [Pseudomonadota bacterium]
MQEHNLAGRAAVIGILSVGLVACGEQSGSANAASSDAPASAETVDAANPKSSDMVLGDDDAPITIVEYASVTCPGCAMFHERFLPVIKEEYIDTGKAKLVFREFPTPPAQLSVIGSVLARCAAEKSGEQGYFAMLSSLFSKQRDWVPNETDHRGELLKITQQAGIDESGFEECLKRQDLVDLIYENVKEAEEVFQVSGTPTFILNGERVSLRNIDAWKEALDAAAGEAPLDDAADDQSSTEKAG